MENIKRIDWIDTAKGLGIFLVVLGHVLPSSNKTLNFKAWIYIFHMPLFFFLSGFTHKIYGLKETYKKTIKQLLIPYVSFSVIYFLFWFSTHYLRSDFYQSKSFFSEYFIKYIVAFFLGNGYSTVYSKMMNCPIWFFWGLFWCKIFFELINSLYRKICKKFISFNFSDFFFQFSVSCFLLLFALFFNRILKIPRFNTSECGGGVEATVFFPFSIETIFLSYPFFWFGFYLKTLNRESIDKNNNNSHEKKIINYLTFFFSFFITVLISYINKNQYFIDINKNEYGIDIFIYIIGALSGIFFIYKLSNLIKISLLRFIGKNSIVILGLHYISFWFIEVAFKHLGYIKENHSVLISLLISVISIFLCSVASLFINKMCPWIIGKK